MKSLVIAEKPSVARDIARVLGANQKNGGILEGKNYVVTWALGHLVTLADPEEYDKKFKNGRWRSAHDSEKWEVVVIRQTGKAVSELKTSCSERMYWRLSLPRMRDGKGSWLPDGFWRNPGATSQLRDCGFLL